MLTVTKEFTFDCAHMLSGHRGLCKNVHGHTYKMHVTVARTDDDTDYEGLVIDFKDLKKLVNDEIINRFDHSFIAWVDGNKAEQTIAHVLDKLGMRIVYVNYRPTAENMAKNFFKHLNSILNRGPYEVISIKVWETPTSYAEYRGE